MPMFTIVIRNREGTPIEGEVSAATVEAAIELARKMGHDVDDTATIALAAAGLDTAGKTSAMLSFLVAIPSLAFPYCGLAGIVLAAMAIEASRGRRGYPGLVVSIMLPVIGLAARHYFGMLSK